MVVQVPNTHLICDKREGMPTQPKGAICCVRRRKRQTSDMRTAAARRPTPDEQRIGRGSSKGPKGCHSTLATTLIGIEKRLSRYISPLNAIKLDFSRNTYEGHHGSDVHAGTQTCRSYQNPSLDAHPGAASSQPYYVNPCSIYDTLSSRQVSQAALPARRRVRSFENGIWAAATSLPRSCTVQCS